MRRLWVVLWGVTIVGIEAFFWMPAPGFMKRSDVQETDYDTMKSVFDQNPLPSSLKIAQVRYAGYSLIFNGPNGPAYSDYELLVDAGDWMGMRKGLLPFMEQKVPPRVWSTTMSFNNDLWDVFIERVAFTEKDDGKWPEYYSVSRPVHGGKYKAWSAVLVDDRSSPTIKLYVQTRAYLWAR
jgi:hypothetical protein